LAGRSAQARGKFKVDKRRIMIFGWLCPLALNNGNLTPFYISFPKYYRAGADNIAMPTGYL
jgi:hypothetical protein